MLTDRRTFLALAMSSPMPLAAREEFGRPSMMSPYSASTPRSPAATRVNFTNELVPRSPEETLGGLAQLAARNGNVEDMYLKGGAVSLLERRIAGIFGKEDAAVMPTGTMANNIAVRVLCGERRRVLVQHDSHLYLDEGDSAAILSGIALFPLASGAVSPSPDQVSTAIDESYEQHSEPVGAISLESPVRRHDNSGVPLETLRAIGGIARRRSVPMHWDGARSLLQIGTPGFDLSATAALFDTIAVSLYKYLEAPWGAVLAGSREVISRARELRLPFGGEMFQGWHAALPALQALETFDRDIRRAHAAMDQLLAGLRHAGGFEVERVSNGSNIAFLQIDPSRLAGLDDRMSAANILIRKPQNGRLLLTLNLSILRRRIDQLVYAFTG